MKSTTWLFVLGACALAGCHSPAQEQAQQTADAIQDAMKTFGPGQVATSEGGYAMTATIDGKPWNASSMMEINRSNEHYIQGSGDDAKLGFYVDTDHPYLGHERKLGEGHSADLMVGDRSWHAIDGGYTIDKADATLIEGRFHFTARAFRSTDTMEVTDGVFRAVPKRD